MDEWIKSEEDCPNCGKKTEVLEKTELSDWSDREITYNIAERCPRCRILVDFEADEIQGVRY